MKHIALLLLTLITLLGASAPTVDIRDLREIKTLDGPWAFSYASLNFDANNTFSVPAYWEEHGFDAVGCATYELFLKTDPEKALTIDISRPHTAYKLFIDGTQVGAVGEIDEKTKTSKPSYRKEFISWTPNGEFSKMTLWVCNSSHRHGGLASAPKIAPAGMLEERSSVSSKIQWMLAGVLLMMGIYHIGLFSAWRRQKAPLWFGLVSLALLLRMSATGEKILLSAYPSISWDMLVRVEYISGYMALPLFVLYIQSLYPTQTPKLAGRIFFTIGVIFSLTVALFPPLFFTATLPYYEAVVIVFLAFISLVLYRSYKAKEPNALTAVVGFLVFGFCILHDILMMVGAIHGGDWMPFGFVFYLLAQAKLLIDRYVGAFHEADRHRNLLEKLNETLEETVEKRTSALTDMLKQRELLLREINHRVKNNLQFIIGLLWLHQSSSADKKAQEQLQEVQRQIKAIASVHEMLCMQKDFAHLNADEYLGVLFSSLQKQHNEVAFRLNVDEGCKLEADSVIALGLVVNELVTNSAKYAFEDGSEKSITLTFSKNDGRYTVLYSDSKNAFDPNEQKSFGLGGRMITDMCKQLRGSIKKEPGSGALKIEFPRET